MRETRLSGSEGGAAQQCAVPTPITCGAKTKTMAGVDTVPRFVPRVGEIIPIT